ncbi:MAG: hypothetical protein ACO36I_19580 [Candidatus Latescibacterota bacterium]
MDMNVDSAESSNQPSAYTLPEPSLADIADDRVAIRVWKKPQAGKRYVIGADVSQGLDNGDDSVMCVLDGETGEQCAEFVGQIDPDEFGLLLYLSGIWFNSAYIGVENNIDLTPLYTLKNLGYQNIHYEWLFRGELVEGRKEKMGWNTNVLTRNKMVNDARLGLKNGLVIHSQVILDQMTVFQRNKRGKYEHIPNAKDDAIFGWMIAVQMLEYQYVAQEFGVYVPASPMEVASTHIGDPNIEDWGIFAEEDWDTDPDKVFERARQKALKEQGGTTMGAMV